MTREGEHLTPWTQPMARVTSRTRTPSGARSQTMTCSGSRSDSKRSYAIDPGTKPQVWVSAIDPAKILDGEDPSSPAFGCRPRIRTRTTTPPSGGPNEEHRLALMVMACGAPKSEQVYAEVDIDEYTGLDTEGLSWTYRDDGDMETCRTRTASSLASRGRRGMDFRRAVAGPMGTRLASYASAERSGAWNLNGVEGNGGYPLGVTSPRRAMHHRWLALRGRPSRGGRTTTAPTRTSSAVREKVRWATGTSPRTWVSWPTTGTLQPEPRRSLVAASLGLVPLPDRSGPWALAPPHGACGSSPSDAGLRGR